LIIKVERNGGLAGLSSSKEIDIRELPTSLAETVRERMKKADTASPPKSIPKGAADYYTYKITFKDRLKTKVIECNQYSIQDDLKSLVSYVQRNAKGEKSNDIIFHA
jgi:hypothetical protein